ncbi:hypothetical protein [Streptomyces chartreusis]|uniref:Amidohydrolase family protein n=1 Tax=Streptomyces chartreusis TaxID=1969 RepID=A0A7H8T137_STRCX|nr:hypothetical protein [Streptomyces chartreusis]QKZ17141.1 hypothetical protein HUT05_07035 [Streptomyces chartreusis]
MSHELIYTYGEDLVDSWAKASDSILIPGAQVAAVGSKANVQSAASTGVEHQNLGGAAFIPGLIDARPHLMHFCAMDAPLVNITQARDRSDNVAAIRKKAEVVPAGEWILTTPIVEYRCFHRRSWHDLAEGALLDGPIRNIPS